MSIYTAIALGASAGFVFGFGEGLYCDLNGKKTIGNALCFGCCTAFVAFTLWAMFA